ncbi:MAG TPA: gluconate 2-dehydrogenase subunit 3 family protein [Vicinamibacterales bacterium]
MSEERETMHDEPQRTVSRRTALKSFGAVGAMAALPVLSLEAAEALATIQRTQAPPKLRVFTPAQYATVDALAETIIPADDHSPGARAARVADYVDLLLSESDAAAKKTWADGVAALDAESQRMFKAPFVKITDAQRVELLTAISRNEADPKTALEQFFKTAKDATIRGYYTSEIGIHKELQYKGNQLLAEFVGCTHPEHGYTAG